METITKIDVHQYKVDLKTKTLFRFSVRDCGALKVQYGPYDDFIIFQAKTEKKNGRIGSRLLAARYLMIQTDADAFEDLDFQIEVCLRLETEYGKFSCSNNLLNRIFDISRHTIHVCMLPNTECSAVYDFLPPANKAIADNWHGKTTDDVLTDGGRRDREVWSGDLLPEIRTAWCMYRDGEIIENSFDLLLGAIDERGHIPASGISLQCLYEYDCWFIIILHEYMMISGNRNYFNENKEKVLRLVHFIESCLDETGVLDLEQRQTWAWTLARKGPLTSSNCVCAKAFAAAAELFSDDSALRRHFLKLSDRIKKNIVARAYDKEQGAYLDVMDITEKRYSLDANAFVVMFDIDTAHTARILDSMQRLFGAEHGMFLMNPKEKPNGQNWVHNDHIWPFVVTFAVEAMFRSGRTREALDLIERTWGTMIENGAQTFWEIIDGKTGAFMKRRLIETEAPIDTWNSASHGWSAGLPLLFYHYIAGIRPVGYGYREAEFSPDFTGLDFLDVEIPAHNGQICMHYEKNDAESYLKFELPRGVVLYNRSGIKELPDIITSGTYCIMNKIQERAI